MFSLNENNRYVVCLQGVDLRKGVDGLCGLIRYLSLNPANGDVYVFHLFSSMGHPKSFWRLCQTTPFVRCPY